MTEEKGRLRFNVRIRTILLAVVIVALALVVVIQQAQLQRVRNLLNEEINRTDRLTAILREQRDMIERQRRPNPSPSQP
jgi:uncharacterized membrane protein